MVEFGEDLPGEGLEFSEVKKNAALVQFLAAQNNLDFPVVPVQILALAPKVFEIVGRGKITEDFHLVNGFFQPSSPSKAFMFFPESPVDPSSTLGRIITKNQAGSA